MVKSKFISDIIKARKDLNIPYNEDCRIINMDETPCFLDMYYETTIDFIGNKNVDIQILERKNIEFLLFWLLQVMI